LASVKLID
jgi:hypothetical protein